MQSDWVLSVGQLNEYVRKQLAGDPILRALRVRGEISGFKRHISGHLYFSIKDEQARVPCVMFRQHAQALAFMPRDGMQVVIRGSASLFVRDGCFQIYCEAIEREGVGELYVRFERLKAKLLSEGLFDASLKKPLPLKPERVGIVTSRSGAAFHDMARVIRRRYPGMGILLAPAAVQGEGAAAEIASALDRLNARGGVDVILCGRGGGSIEDLWAFNEEIVARAIARSAIPVISCVGHETDFTIADFVADVRAATPSVAAELAVPVREELAREIVKTRLRMARAQRAYLRAARTHVDRLYASPAIRAPKSVLLGARRQAVDRAMEAASDRMGLLMMERRAKLNVLKQAVNSLNPASVIDRGYALVLKNGAPVASANQLSREEVIDIRMRGGEVRATVDEIKKTRKRK